MYSKPVQFFTQIQAVKFDGQVNFSWHFRLKPFNSTIKKLQKNISFSDKHVDVINEDT